MYVGHTGKYFTYAYVTQIFKSYAKHNTHLGAKVSLTFGEKSQKLSMRAGVLAD